MNQLEKATGSHTKLKKTASKKQASQQNIQ